MVLVFKLAFLLAFFTLGVKCQQAHRSLTCSHDNVGHFNSVLDFDGWEPHSGYFNVLLPFSSAFKSLTCIPLPLYPTLAYPTVPLYTPLYPSVPHCTLLYPTKPHCTPLYSQVVNATIVDNYNYAELTCNGNSFSSPINCVGFNNGMGDSIFYITINKAAEATIWLSYTAIMGHGGPLAGTKWDCILQ